MHPHGVQDRVARRGDPEVGRADQDLVQRRSILALSNRTEPARGPTQCGNRRLLQCRLVIRRSRSLMGRNIHCLPALRVPAGYVVDQLHCVAVQEPGRHDADRGGLVPGLRHATLVGVPNQGSALPHLLEEVVRADVKPKPHRNGDAVRGRWVLGQRVDLLHGQLHPGVVARGFRVADVNGLVDRGTCDAGLLHIVGDDLLQLGVLLGQGGTIQEPRSNARGRILVAHQGPELNRLLQVGPGLFRGGPPVPAQNRGVHTGRLAHLHHHAGDEFRARSVRPRLRSGLDLGLFLRRQRLLRSEFSHCLVVRLPPHPVRKRHQPEVALLRQCPVHGGVLEDIGVLGQDALGRAQHSLRNTPDPALRGVEFGVGLFCYRGHNRIHRGSLRGALR